MTEADRKTLLRLAGGDSSDRSGVDDLQGLLLQVVFALLMVFMIAYFIFVESSRKERKEEVLELNRQKLVLALEKTAENRRIKYGLNALMTQGIDGRRSFDPSEHVKGDRLEIAPAAKTAFSAGSRAAVADYRDLAALSADWHTNVLAEAGLSAEALEAPELAWLEDEITRRIEEVRLDARGVQRSLAARLQLALIERPEIFGDVRDPAVLADLIKRKSLEIIKAESGGEMLP